MLYTILSLTVFIALLVGVVVLSHRRGVDLNVGERPVNPYRR